MTHAGLHLPFLTALILSPALALALILFTPEKRSGWVKGFALASASFSLALSLFLAFTYDSHQGGFQFIETHAWLPQLGITYTLGIDGISLPMVILTSLVTFALTWKP